MCVKMCFNFLQALIFTYTNLLFSGRLAKIITALQFYVFSVWALMYKYSF